MASKEEGGEQKVEVEEEEEENKTAAAGACVDEKKGKFENKIPSETHGCALSLCVLRLTALRSEAPGIVQKIGGVDRKAGARNENGWSFFCSVGGFKKKFESFKSSGPKAKALC